MSLRAKGKRPASSSGSDEEDGAGLALVTTPKSGLSTASASYTFVPRLERERMHPRPAFTLQVRQDAKQARVCSFKEKVDRRPIDPPPIVQMRSTEPNPEEFFQCTSFFMTATLVSPDAPHEEVFTPSGQQSTAGTTLQTPSKLKDIDGTEGAFCIWPHLSVRVEGTYLLRFRLYEIVGLEVIEVASALSGPLVVYAPKLFPGMSESSYLTRCFADQGVRVRIRKENKVAQVKRIRTASDPPAAPSPTVRTGVTASQLAAASTSSSSSPAIAAPALPPAPPLRTYLPHDLGEGLPGLGMKGEAPWYENPLPSIGQHPGSYMSQPSRYQSYPAPRAPTPTHAYPGTSTAQGGALYSPEQLPQPLAPISSLINPVSSFPPPAQPSSGYYSPTTLFASPSTRSDPASTSSLAPSPIPAHARTTYPPMSSAGASSAYPSPFTQLHALTRPPYGHHAAYDPLSNVRTQMDDDEPTSSPPTRDTRLFSPAPGSELPPPPLPPERGDLQPHRYASYADPQAPHESYAPTPYPVSPILPSTSSAMHTPAMTATRLAPNEYDTSAPHPSPLPTPHPPGSSSISQLLVPPPSAIYASPLRSSSLLPHDPRYQQHQHPQHGGRWDAGSAGGPG